MTRNQNLAVAAIAAAVLFGACSDEWPLLSVKSPAPGNYQATLTGAAEVPAVTTTASGSATITILDTNLIRVQVNVLAIDSVTNSHIHAGDATTAGPVMVGIFGPFTNGAVVPTGVGSTTTTTLNGVLRVLDINRSSAFSGVYKFDSLMTRIKNGTAYVNVHTRKNGGGEIRGQIVPKT